MNLQEIECLAQICQKMVHVNFCADCQVTLFVWSTIDSFSLLQKLNAIRISFYSLKNNFLVSLFRYFNIIFFIYFSCDP